jgi:hypothetical protein
MRRARRFLFLTSISVSFAWAPSCVQPLGGEGQPCASDGRCGVGFICDENVCRAPSAAVGGSSPSSGGSVPVSNHDGAGGSAGEAPGDASGGAALGGGNSTGGNDAGGAATTGGLSSVGGAGTGGASSEATGGTGSGGGPTGPNLLENGDFSSGEQHWKLDAGNTSFHGVRDGAYCIESSSEIDFGLSAPGVDEEPFALQSGKTYTLTYGVRGVSSWTAKVGLADSPYTAFGEWQDSVSEEGTLQLFVHTFDVDDGNERVGFIFQGRVNGEVCFDDIGLATSD